jgi:hypothetical protein
MKQDNFINLLHFYKDITIIKQLIKVEFRKAINKREAFGNLHHYRNVQHRIERELSNLTQ